MPDIMACKNSSCEKSKDCWRYMCIPSQYQSYGEFQNICKTPDFKWFYQIDDKPIRKEELNEKLDDTKQ